ncbi:MAG: endolytic transglycosylase MltG, partial [Muribaculaceae bacterium]|nr:endolytic transglycosylase MltG [Muribaculaceae bacterium]
AIDSIAAKNNIDKECSIAIILPDTYQFYWTASARNVAESMYREWSRYWNDERLRKAGRLGLGPVEVSTLASIVEEESAKTDERPVIARLYLNRLSRGMKLQSDPTVKYAVGDPTLRRILNSHLKVESPYNTYIHDGLPPSPIRMVDKSTIDGVLNAPMHGYIYMCAKEDFSGYHNFAKTLSEHNANAARYHRALNSRGIK